MRCPDQTAAGPWITASWTAPTALPLVFRWPGAVCPGRSGSFDCVRTPARRRTLRGRHRAVGPARHAVAGVLTFGRQDMVSSSGRDSEPRRPAYPGTPRAASPRDSWFAASPVTGEQPASHAPPPPAAGGTERSPVTRSPRDRLRTVLVGAAAILIIISVIIMIAVLAAGPSMAVIRIPRPAAGPPWWFSLHPSTPLVTFALWAAAGRLALQTPRTGVFFA